MKHKLVTLVLAVAVIVSLVVVGCAKPAPAPEPAPPPAPTPAPTPAPPETVWPKDVVCCSPATGTAININLVGIGTPVMNHTPIEYWIVQPLGGPTIWGPLMKKGEMDFAMHNGADILQNVFLGREAFEEIGPVPVRTVTVGYFMAFCWYTTPGSGIKSITDLKGKRVYNKLKGNPMFSAMAEAQLNSVGLTTDDLKSAECMPSAKEAVADLIEGRIDAFIFPTVKGLIMQINEAKGECVFLNLTKEQADFVAEKMPGYFPYIVEAGDPRFSNKSEIRYAICFRTALHVRADMDPEIVYGVVKSILEHMDEWQDCHPCAKYFGTDYGPAATCSEPYHEGAIKYFKEIGLWTDELQEHQDKYLKLQQELLEKR